VVFEVLHPDAPAHAKERPGNADSCVLRVQAPGASALLTGDIDQSVERALTAAWTLQASAAAKPALKKHQITD
jgi:competence protein ComEC